MDAECRESSAANTVGQENSKSKRRQRRANQHEEIHCVLHKSREGLLKPGRAFQPLPLSFDVILSRREGTLTRFSVAE